MKYRKKPVVVEAEQFTGEPMHGVCWDGRTNPHVHTAHGSQTVTLEPGDWVIPEPDGEHFYPCKADIFEATYEPVTDEVITQKYTLDAKLAAAHE